MSTYLQLLFTPILASFGCFIAFDYFATPSLHGVLSGDILLLLFVLMMPRKSKFKFFLILCGLGTMFFNPIIGASILYIVVISFIKRDQVWPSVVPITLFILFSVIADCAVFFKKTFMINLAQLWEISSFFWWGGVLYFLVPMAYVTAIVWFSRKILWKRESISLSSIRLLLVFLLMNLINIAVSSFQNRMQLVDYPIYRCFQDYNVFKPFDGLEPGMIYVESDSLAEDTKKVFPIWNLQNSLVIQDKAVFILIESYGVNKDTSIAKQMIFTPFMDANVSFAGILSRRSMHTQGAEVEDLGYANYFDSNEIEFLSSLKKKNIESWYLHGYVGTFYSRDKTYKQFGFDSLLFMEDLKKRDVQMCNYGFSGVCDSSIINVIDSILYRPRDKFVFWTTLDSHPPYDRSLELPAYSVFCKNLKVSDKECMYFSLIDNTLKKIVALAKRHPDYQFVIRGDHRPMGTIDPDNFYFAWVPMIILN